MFLGYHGRRETIINAETTGVIAIVFDNDREEHKDISNQKAVRYGVPT